MSFETAGSAPDQEILLYSMPIADISVQTDPVPADPYYILPAGTTSSSTGVLLSTRWSQSGTAKVGNNTTITYNQYCPFRTDDPSYRAVTGCTNTAAGQIIHYYVEKFGFDLQLTLTAADEYTFGSGSVIKADGSTPGTVSFSVINDKIAHYDVNSADDCAALVYACGVVQKAEYGKSTSTAWNTSLFFRAGFECINGTEWYYNSNKVTLWGEKNKISEGGFEVLIENLTAGRVVGTSYPGHALVIDGYNAENDTFHINFGWGNNSATAWYTRDQMNEQGYNHFLYDIMIDGEKDLFVTDSRIYGTGTTARAFELADGTVGGNTITFSQELAGKDLHTNFILNCSEGLTVNGFNMDMMFDDVGYAFYNRSGVKAAFDHFTGSIIVNNDSSTYGFYFSSGESLSIDADNAIIYAGYYTVRGDLAAGSQAVMDSLSVSQKNGTAVADLVLSSSGSSYNAYAVYGTNSNDAFSFDNSSIVVGDIVLGRGDDTLALRRGTRVFGDINCGTGDDVITIDSSSSFTGSISNTGKLNFLLNTRPGSSPILSIEKNIALLRSNITFTADLAGASPGKYTLITADAGSGNLDNLNNIVITVSAGGSASYALSVNGSYSCSFAKLLREGNSLVLQVTGYDSTDKTPPAKPEATPDITELTNSDVTVSVKFSDDSAVRQYRIGNGAWQEYTTAFTVSANALLTFRAKDAAGNESLSELRISNIDKTPPAAPRVTADITELTSSDVTVTALYSEDSVLKQFKRDDGEWQEYTGPVKVSSNSFLVFRAVDGAGNESSYEFNVDYIDKLPPAAPKATPDIVRQTNSDVTVTVKFSDDSVIRQYRIGNDAWQDYTKAFTVSANTTLSFRAADAAGNESSSQLVISNIDRTPPEAPVTSVSTTALTRSSVSVTAVYASDALLKQFKYNDGEWQDYTESFSVSANTLLTFRAVDAAGNESCSELRISNIDNMAPEVPSGFQVSYFKEETILEWEDKGDQGIAGLSNYLFRFGKTLSSLKGAEESITENRYVLNDLEPGTYYYQVRAEDKLGNISPWSNIRTFEVYSKEVNNISSTSDGSVWDPIPGFKSYTAEYSLDNFAHTLTIESPSNGIDLYGLPAGNYRLRVYVVDAVITDPAGFTAERKKGSFRYVSDGNGKQDVFFAKSQETWLAGYFARHTGNGSWEGTGEEVALSGKNRISDIFIGSDDASILLLSDGANGDALFIDDIFTALPDGEEEPCARLSMINEIRGGYGNDVIDLTSSNFACAGGMKICGGRGNDVIWANSGSNILFGDAGNDRLTGGSGDDILVGGAGRDTMHGGGGNDIFTFGGSFGTDTVEQLEGGTVTLWFEEDNGFWDEEKCTYSVNGSSVTVKGVAKENIILKFGGDISQLPEGAFADYSTSRIYEEKNNGTLA